MPRAILRDGVICPIEPLPPEWTDGRELRVEDAQEPEESAEAIDKWYQDLQALAADIDAEDEKHFLATIAEVRREAKELARREMELEHGRISPGHESSQ